MPCQMFTNNHSLQTAKLQLSISVRSFPIATQTIDLLGLMHGEVIVHRARWVNDMHHFERAYRKTGLIDVTYGPFHMGRIK